MKRRPKTKAKPVTLDPRIWVRSGKDTEEYRRAKLRAQGGRCAVTGAKIKTGVLDHTHEGGAGEDGRVRGVLDTQVNMLEGRFQHLFDKSKIGEKFSIHFEDFLIALGTYLKQDNSEEKFFYRYMDEHRKVVKRWHKETLIKHLEDDFGICANKRLTVNDLVQMYMQNWVREVEKLY